MMFALQRDRERRDMTGTTASDHVAEPARHGAHRNVDLGARGPGFYDGAMRRIVFE
jgi:hypothetical protein